MVLIADKSSQSFYNAAPSRAWRYSRENVVGLQAKKPFNIKLQAIDI